MIDIDGERNIQDDIIQRRDQDIHVIKNQMRDVNDIFKGLATIIEGQSEVVGMNFLYF